MKAEEITLALRMVAMGRINHPLVEQLAGTLERVFGSALPVLIEPPPQVVTDEAVKRSRKAKAE